MLAFRVSVKYNSQSKLFWLNGKATCADLHARVLDDWGLPAELSEAWLLVDGQTGVGLDYARALAGQVKDLKELAFVWADDVRPAA